MAVTKKKKSAPSPPPAASSAEEEEEERPIPKPTNPNQATNPNSSGKSESRSGKAPKKPAAAPTKQTNPPPVGADAESATQKPSEEEEEDSSSEKEKEEKKRKSKHASKNGKEYEEAQQMQPNHVSTKGCIKRIWSESNELAFLEFLREYKKKNGEMPQKKNYPAMLSEFNRPTNFTATELQLDTKIRMFKDKVRKGPGANKTSHDKLVYEMCMDLFAKPSKKHKGKKRKIEASRSAVEEVNNGAFPSHLVELIRDAIKSPADVISHIEESVLNDFETQAKMLKIEAIKLRANEDELRVKVLRLLAGSMENH